MKKAKVSKNIETEALKSQLARALADYDNLQKRVEREKADGKYLARLVIISRLLPVFDMFMDAQKHLNDQGLAIAIKVLQDTLKEDGIVEIFAKEGDVFNHEVHEAVDTVFGDESQEHKIANVSLAGYRFLDGPVIRHAKVTVYKKQEN